MGEDGTALNRAAYDSLAGRYAARQRSAIETEGRETGFLAVESEFMRRLTPGALLADLGCGPSYDGARLSAAGHRVVGMDLSAGMLTEAARVLGPGRVAQADLRALPVRSGVLDGIWCAASLLHVPEVDTLAVLAGFRRALRAGGLLALVTALGSGARLELVPYAPEVERWFVYRTAGSIRAALDTAGFDLGYEAVAPSNRDWLTVLAEAR